MHNYCYDDIVSFETTVLIPWLNSTKHYSKYCILILLRLENIFFATKLLNKLKNYIYMFVTF